MKDDTRTACPRCGGALVEHAQTKGPAVRACGRGHGLWMPAGAVAARLSRDTLTRLRERAHDAAVGTVACAGCASPMHALLVTSPGDADVTVEVDFCEGCDAFWFDAGEMNQILPDQAKKTRPTDASAAPSAQTMALEGGADGVTSVAQVAQWDLLVDGVFGLLTALFE